MNPSFEHALFERHPRLLRYLRERGRQGYSTFECDDGWFAFLDEALSSFEQAVVDIPTNSDDYPDLTMVKSKFGELRISMAGRSSIPNFEDIYRALQKKGKTTCEFCGKPGRITDHSGYFAVNCGKCVPPS
jgi:hypothetical protein